MKRRKPFLKEELIPSIRQEVRKGILAFSVFMFPLTFFFLSPFVTVLSAASGIVNGSAMVFGLLLLFPIFGSRTF